MTIQDLKDRPSRLQSGLLASLAIFAMLWIITRASIQAITIDEAVSFLNFAYLPSSSHWSPHANNHVLNSMVTRVFGWLFGPSHLTVRSGAVTAGAIYLVGAWKLCRLIFPTSMLQLLLFICLVFNPIVMDFLVVGRGYGLALAFLLCTILVLAQTARKSVIDNSTLIKVCVLCSIFAALSFVANFSFAFVNAAVLIVTYVWAVRLARFPGEVPPPDPFLSARKKNAPIVIWLAIACVLPGILITAILAGPMLLHFPRNELVHGATSLGQTIRSVIEGSFFELNPYIVSPDLYPIVQKWGKFLLLTLCIFLSLRVITAALTRERPMRQAWLASFAAILFAALALTLMLHWIAFRFFDILLPEGRTALYLIPLSTILAALITALPSNSSVSRYARIAAVGTMSILAGYFVLCLRLGYFMEWKWDSDTDKLYEIIAHYNHTCDLKEVPVNWRYDASLNYYRVASGRETFREFQGGLGQFGEQFYYPQDKRAYVLYFPEDQTFIADNSLIIIYRGETGSAVAVRPTQAASSPQVSCEASYDRPKIAE